MPNSPPTRDFQIHIQDLDLDLDSSRLDGQPNGSSGLHIVFGDTDDATPQHLLSNNSNEQPSEIQNSGSDDFIDSLARDLWGPAENQSSEIVLAPPIQTTWTSAENLLSLATGFDYGLDQHPITNIEIPSFPTTDTEHWHSVDAATELLHSTIETEDDSVNQLFQIALANIEDQLFPAVNIENSLAQYHNQTAGANVDEQLVPTAYIEHNPGAWANVDDQLPAVDIEDSSAQYRNQTTWENITTNDDLLLTADTDHFSKQYCNRTASTNSELLLPTIETDFDLVQDGSQTVTLDAPDPSDFFFKSFPHKPNDLKRTANTEPPIPNRKKRKTPEAKLYDLKASCAMQLMSEPPKTLIADARNLGIHSVMPLFKIPTEKGEISTRKPVAKQYLSMQISRDWYLQIQAAAKLWMLDVSYPQRMGSVGLKTRAGADSTELFDCCMEFLEQQWGENCWGRMADSFEGRDLVWPEDKNEITNRVMPLLRRVVTNERQRIYAAEKRKGRKDGSFESHSATPDTPNSPFILFTPHTISSTTSSRLFPEGHQARKLDDPEIRARVLGSPSPAHNNTSQPQHTSALECNLAVSRRTSTSSKMSETSGNDSDFSLTTRTDMSSTTEASMIRTTEVTKSYVEPAIKLHIDFLERGRPVQEMAVMYVTIHTTFSCFIRDIRAMIGEDLMMLKNIRVLSSERSFDVDNPKTWNEVLVEVMERVCLNPEAKVIVEVEEDLFGEEGEVSPFVT